MCYVKRENRGRLFVYGADEAKHDTGCNVYLCGAECRKFDNGLHYDEQFYVFVGFNANTTRYSVRNMLERTLDD
jgi:hypothetical protein